MIKLKNSKGITLKALIVIIIMVLILLGVIIWQATSDDGLIKKMLLSVDKYNETSEQENRDKKDKYTERKGLNPEVNPDTGLATAKYIKEFTKDLKITIPEGFGIAQLDSSEFKRVIGVMPSEEWDAYLTQENVYDNGVVVIDASGNEFVWVPVKAGTIWWNNNGQKVGQLWVIKGNNDSGTKITSYIANIGLREPDIVIDMDWKTTNLKTALGVTNDEDLKEILGLSKVKKTSLNDYANAFKEILQTEFNQMITSVDNYGGFYIGRYETGGFNTSQCVVKAGEKIDSISSVNWYTMYNKTKTLSTPSVASTLIWGCQYDAMCNWLNSASRKIQSDDTRTEASTIETGIIASDMDKNIYDLAGNVVEWTMESYGSIYRVCRGGLYRIEFPVSYKDYMGPEFSFITHGGRATLYIL